MKTKLQFMLQKLSVNYNDWIHFLYIWKQNIFVEENFYHGIRATKLIYFPNI